MAKPLNSGLYQRTKVSILKNTTPMVSRQAQLCEYMSVIVTNAKNRISYAIVKSLGQKGINVFTSDFMPFSMAFASKYSKGHFLYPSPFEDQKAFIDSIIRNIHRLNARVLIPVFEETFLISKFKERLSKHVRMAIPDYEQILTTHNKDKWLPIAKKLSIPVPQSFTIAELKNYREKIKELHFPVLVKPKQGGGAWGILLINSVKELGSLFEGETYMGLPLERFFVQEKINGHAYCVAMLFNQGELKGQVVYRQLRDFPVSGGQATLRVSVDHPQLAGYFQKLLTELNWHGICQADFQVEQETGIPYLIDINPRFWGSLVQGIASKVDFPYLLYKIAIDGDVKPLNGFEKNVMTRWIGGDIRGFPHYFKQSNNKAKFIKDFFALNTGKVTYDDFDIKDLLPFLTWGIDSIRKIIKYRTLKPTTHDSLEGIWE